MWLQRFNPQDLEIMQEKASALGRAGERLETALKCCRQAQQDNKPSNQLEYLCAAAATRLWELAVQRELLGFVHRNEEWIKECYQIPVQVWQQFRRM